jgi:hypothetical protein
VAIGLYFSWANEKPQILLALQHEVKKNCLVQLIDNPVHKVLEKL